jgi:protein-S-isoprenylcysteine O-methyltransferase Ste14
MKLAAQMLLSSIVGLALFGLLLFWPAGTFAYWQAWVFIAVFIVTTVVPSGWLAVRDPAALRRRMKSGPAAESRPVQKLVISATFLLVFAVLVVSALDHRFGWSHVPAPVVILGDVLVVVGLTVAQLVIVQNSYAAATITVETGQKLASTGLYGVVRHPMYAGTLVMMVGMPLALDSYWGLLSLIPGFLVLAVRILDEEKLLRDELDGYAEYMRRVRYRVVPYVW